jgi:hypothetical protein
MLSEKNYREKINSYSISEWKPLFDMIPKIEGTEVFGEFMGPEEVEEGVFSFPHYKYGEIISEFIRIVYDMTIIISFDWAHWEGGRYMASEADFDFDTIDIPTKCKIITAIVRNDRFHDGALLSAFESGVILKMLHSIQRQLRQKGEIQHHKP